jgi:tRNA(Ile)-lysidine synthase
MASSRKPQSVEAAVRAFLDSYDLKGKRVAVGLSGGVDSVVLLHVVKRDTRVSAVHVHHGLSPNAESWTRFCKKLCREWRVPLTVRRVKVRKRGKGLEAAAREARYKVFKSLRCDSLLLAHQLDDQAETVLMNLLRGAGRRGARGMAQSARLDGKLLLRPLLDVPRTAILAYARSEGLQWIDDESNADPGLTRNYLRLRVAPLVEAKFPRWRENLARAARHFAAEELRASDLLRDFLAAHGLKAPSEAKLVEMLKQLVSGGTRTLLEHDGAALRVYRGKAFLTAASREASFKPLAWRGEQRLKLPALGGELRFRKTRGSGIDARLLKSAAFEVRLRSGGERLQPDPRRPRRTLKNLFQEAGVPPWQRERLPMLFSGSDLVWAPGLGTDVRYQAPRDVLGVVPSWSNPLFLRKSRAGRAKIVG